MKTERLEFIGHDGSLLAARLDLPTGKPAAYALFAHCFTCSKDIPAARRIAQREDLLLAASHLREKYQAPQLLIGHSLGGAAILAAAERIAEAKVVVTIGAPADPHHVAQNFGQQLASIQTNGQAQVQLGGRTFTIKQQFLDDISKTTLAKQVGSLKKALLVLHAPLDETVGLENATSIFQMAKHPKSFVSLDGADHLLTKVEDAEYAAELIVAWVQRYINVNLLPKLMNAPEGIVRVQFERKITFTGDISEEERQRLLVIADRCPVHKTLEGQVNIITRLT